MIRKNRPNKQLVAEINVVPYIDVMLVLLVIFIVTAPLLQQGVNVDLPQASAKTIETTELEPLIVSVDNEGNFYLNIASEPHLPINPDEMRAQLTTHIEQNPKRKTLVKADNQVNYGKVMQAMVLLQQAGANNVGLVTQDIGSSQVAAR